MRTWQRTTVSLPLRSKRRSATSSATSRLHEVIFFCDRGLGRRVFPAPLLEAGLRLELHDDHFPQEAKDRDWLPVVGAKGWVVLTADGRIRYRGLETEALMRAEVRCFVLSGIGAGHPQLAANFLQALPRIEELLAERPGPFIAKVYRGGEVKIWLDLVAWRASQRSEVE